MFHPMLTHRADVYRQDPQDSEDGSFTLLWQKVAEGVPCLLTIPNVEIDFDATPAVQKRAVLSAYVIFKPSADVLPLDLLVFSRPAGFGKARVTHRGGPVPGPNGLSHVQFHAFWDDGSTPS